MTVRHASAATPAAPGRPEAVRRRSWVPAAWLASLVVLAPALACGGAGEPGTAETAPPATAEAAAGAGERSEGARDASSRRSTPAFEITQVTADVYHARGVGEMSVGSNAAIVVNETDVLLVDSHISPAAANALLEELRPITDKPVRYVVNTHYHFDHVHGNQVYPPEVEVIGHELTREVIASGGSVRGRSYDTFIGGLPARIEALAERADTTSDPDARAGVETNLERLRRFKAQTDEVVPVPPNTTLSERLTLFRGEREIRLLFFGRGHTGGDVVVHLPGDGVLITGDLLTEGLPYMGDGYIDEWIVTLGHLEGLEFEWILPGHGRAFRDRAKIGHLRAYLRDLWERASEMHERGVAAAEAAERVDMTDHADRFPGIEAPGVHPHAVLRIYEQLEGGV